MRVIDLTDQKAKDAALKAVAVRPRTAFEMRKILERKQFSAEVISAAIAWLVRENFIDDLDFAISWIEFRSELKPAGQKLLMRELFIKGVPRDIIEKAFF